MGASMRWVFDPDDSFSHILADTDAAARHVGDLSALRPSCRISNTHALLNPRPVAGRPPVTGRFHKRPPAVTEIRVTLPVPGIRGRQPHGGLTGRHQRREDQEVSLPVVVKRFQPVMWVQLPGGYTVRWRQGEAVAYVFADQQTSDSEDGIAAIDTIPVSRTGWTDIAEVRLIANRWLRVKST